MKMTNLTERQKKFLKDELGVGDADLENMTEEGWMDVRDKCMWISVEELVDEDGNAIDDDITERCEIAESIMDMGFKRFSGKSRKTA